MRKNYKRLFAALLVLALVVSVFPQAQAKAAEGKKTVRTDAELDKALSSDSIKTITIKTDKKENFTIKGDYSDKNISSNSPNASISVNGSINNLNIKSAGEVTLGAKAAVSTIKITPGNDLNLKLKKNSTVDKLVINASDNAGDSTSIAITNNGNIGNLGVNNDNGQVAIANNNSIGRFFVAGTADLSLSGKAKSVTSLIVKKSAEGASISLSLDCKVNAYVSIDLSLSKGAGKSTITVKNGDAEVNVSNNTKKNISILDQASGVSTEVESGGAMSATELKDSIATEVIRINEEKKAAEEEAANANDNPSITPSAPTTTYEETEATLEVGNKSAGQVMFHLLDARQILFYII